MAISFVGKGSPLTAPFLTHRHTFKCDLDRHRPPLSMPFCVSLQPPDMISLGNLVGWTVIVYWAGLGSIFWRSNFGSKQKGVLSKTNAHVYSLVCQLSDAIKRYLSYRGPTNLRRNEHRSSLLDPGQFGNYVFFHEIRQRPWTMFTNIDEQQPFVFWCPPGTNKNER